MTYAPPLYDTRYAQLAAQTDMLLVHLNAHACIRCVYMIRFQCQHTTMAYGGTRDTVSVPASINPELRREMT